jgi:hypothetical protein
VCRTERRSASAQAHALLATLEAIAASLTFDGPAAQGLHRVVDDVRLVADEVDSFDAQFFRLEVVDQGQEALAQAGHLWNGLPAGRHLAGSAPLDRLVHASAALQPLTARGFKFPMIEKFSMVQNEVARALGDDFGRWHRAWDGLRFALRGGDAEPVFKVGIAVAKDTEHFLRRMRHLGAISSFEFEARARGAEDDAWVPVAKRPATSTHECRARVQPGQPELVAMVRGLWLNAYAHRVIGDHLTSNGIGHELMTDVSYVTPGDVVAERGDLDVIGRFGNTLLIVECKSGRLEAGSSELKKVIAKDRSVRAALGVDPAIRVVSLLVYNPFRSQDHAGLVAALDGSDIMPVAPSELRTAIADIVASA